MGWLREPLSPDGHPNGARLIAARDNGGKAFAAMDGRFTVSIEDIQRVAVPVLRHRISTNFQAQAEGMSTEDVISRLLKEIPIPEIPKYSGQ